LYIDKLKHHFGRSIGPPQDMSFHSLSILLSLLYIDGKLIESSPGRERLGRPCSAVTPRQTPHLMVGVFPPISNVDIKKKVISVKCFDFNHYLVVLNYIVWETMTSFIDSMFDHSSR